MLTLNPTATWLHGVRYCPSPHHDDRPPNTPIDLIVIHNISLPPGEFSGPCIDQLFLGRLDTSAHPYFTNLTGLTVSAHCLIRRTGEITQYVSLQKRAWHAGLSCFNGRSRCNDFSIGIELEGTDYTPYTPQQYQQLVALIALLQNTWPHLTRSHIVGHCHIAPDRKTDPGPSFDWQQLYHHLDTIS